eukprot:TRINITY_DN15451_c0_g1_i1.p1 TRINITY_DN15451_c0_g1~~TRINITY_DN15451_c0_g1_i1.p1  ORF type:complete len:130 (-),score=11.92 TRINITY_DN15451_c0_g1_i1:350-739(-)
MASRPLVQAVQQEHHAAGWCSCSSAKSHSFSPYCSPMALRSPLGSYRVHLRRLLVPGVPVPVGSSPASTAPSTSSTTSTVGRKRCLQEWIGIEIVFVTVGFTSGLLAGDASFPELLEQDLLDVFGGVAH